MSNTTLIAKLSFDEHRLRQYHLTIARGCRDAAKLAPEHARALRRKMQEHAYLAYGKTPPPAKR